MFARSLLTATAALLIAAPAYAFQCPSMAAEIDEQLANANLSKEVEAQVLELRDRGMELHESGQHQASVDTLAEAQQLLDQNM